MPKVSSSSVIILGLASWCRRRPGIWPADGWPTADSCCSVYGHEAKVVHMALLIENPLRDRSRDFDMQEWSVSLGRCACHAPAIRLERTIQDLYGLRAVGLPDQRPWLDHRPLGRTTSARNSSKSAAAFGRPIRS